MKYAAEKLSVRSEETRKQPFYIPRVVARVRGMDHSPFWNAGAQLNHLNTIMWIIELEIITVLLTLKYISLSANIYIFTTGQMD